MVISDEIKTELALSESAGILSGQESGQVQRGNHERHNSDASRFQAKVQRVDDHWLWSGAKSASGAYGQFWYNGERIGAHVAAWLIYRGEIADGLEILHQCQFKVCVNPDHLALGTHAENLQQAVVELGPDGFRSVKLSAEDVRAIRVQVAAGVPQKELAARYGVWQSAISNIVRRVTWGWLA